ncbi:phage tail sheath family protein, partial [Streptomyces sp. NPDC054804]
MPSYLSPGVYVEEVASGSRPIEGVGTSVAAFVGLAPTGPLNEPTLVTNWTQYVASFGEFTDGYYLAHSVYGFFNNGGTAAYVVRVGGTREGADGAVDAPAAVGSPAAPAALPPGEAKQLGTFTVSAVASGDLSVEVADPEGEGPAERFKLVVKDGGKAVETFDVTAKKGGRNYVVTQVKERSKLITVTEAAPAAQLARPENQTVALVAPTPAPGGGGPPPRARAPPRPPPPPRARARPPPGGGRGGDDA